MKHCISCGMPLVSKIDYPLGDMTKNYCVHCSRPDGGMQSYEEKLASMSALIAQREAIAKAEAQEMARDILVKLPAWKGHA